MSHQIFEIVVNKTVVPKKAGYLYAYANDAWLFYEQPREDPADCQETLGVLIFRGHLNRGSIYVPMPFFDRAERRMHLNPVTNQHSRNPYHSLPARCPTETPASNGLVVREI